MTTLLFWMTWHYSSLLLSQKMSKMVVAALIKIVFLFSYRSFQTKHGAHTGQTGDSVIKNKNNIVKRCLVPEFPPCDVIRDLPWSQGSSEGIDLLHLLSHSLVMWNLHYGLSQGSSRLCCRRYMVQCWRQGHIQTRAQTVPGGLRP